MIVEIGYGDWVICELYLIQNYFVLGRDYVYYREGSKYIMTFMDIVSHSRFMRWWGVS